MNTNSAPPSGVAAVIFLPTSPRNAGIEAVRALGAEAVVLLGHPTYYPRFGFSADAARRLASPYAGSPAFMALALTPGALSEPLKVDFPAAFG